MYSMPKTERNIYRLGYPIPFPPSYDEAIKLLGWALTELHEHQHAANTGKSGYMADTKIEDTGSDYCRLRHALTDPRFLCEDKWHLVYQKEAGPCPTCGNGWIATLTHK